ncbi:MAG: glycosyltransferase family 4 protein [Kiritimatiellae bacterium]|nr:glycosyltransferase family 4 protein [Kiritimatiellia bacterium]MCO5068203.1 glycosyltransferase family 4 protein [Kiritimatiellia bacterium]
MKISFLMPDMNGPVLGPVTVLARHLQSAFEVEIIGPDLGHGVCAMYRGAFPYRVIPAAHIYRYPEYFRERRRLADAVTGDIVIPVKAVGDTIPVALMLKRQRGVRVLPYLDEWDGALMAQRPPLRRIARWLQHAHHPLEDVYYPLVERLIPQCDSVISTSTFLQKKFGGHVIPMGVDCDYFQPTPSEATQALKRELGLDGKRLIVFGGVVRPHKGIEAIPQAVARSGVQDLRFVIVGPINEHVKALLADPQLSPFIATVGAQPRERMPAFLSMADLIVLPLQDTLLAQSQVPCKIFEAMAMARPIIASDVSDMAQILDGCGWVVPPNDVDRLAKQIGAVLADPAEARRRSILARERCIDRYSKDVTRHMLIDIISNLSAVSPKPRSR